MQKQSPCEGNKVFVKYQAQGGVNPITSVAYALAIRGVVRKNKCGNASKKQLFSSERSVGTRKNDVGMQPRNRHFQSCNYTLMLVWYAPDILSFIDLCDVWSCTQEI